jgi:hypothetical protein
MSVFNNELIGGLDSPVKLLPHQVDHVDNIWRTITERGELSYIDTSRTGLGKTHVALEIAYRLQKLIGMRIAIIGPNKQSLNNDDGWLWWVKKYNLVIEKATTYSALRGKGFVIADDWLCRDINGYHSTNKFNSITQAGLFIIFDEFHMATRNSDTHFACAALVRSCRRNATRCRIGLLSLTPGDKVDHYPQLVRMAGLINSTTLLKYNRSNRTYIWKNYGIHEMIKSCEVRGVPQNIMLMEMDRLSMRRAKYLVAMFYNDYIRSRICFSMPAPEIDKKVVTKNRFLECVEGDVDNLNKAIGRLCDGVNWDGYTVAEKEKWNLGQINIALKLIERYKLRTIARYIENRARKYPEKKFIVSMGSRCTAHFGMLKDILSSLEVTVPTGIDIILNKARKESGNVWSNINNDMYNTIMKMAYKPKIDIMNGQTGPEERVKILRRFQHKDSDSWCLLLSPGVGDKSISLHDTHGNHPRELIIIPDHYHTRMTQMTGRTNRVGVMSDVKISIIYCKETRLETSIIRAMIQKSITAKNMLSPGQDHLFPGNYDLWVEKDKENKVLNEIRDEIY